MLDAVLIPADQQQPLRLEHLAPNDLGAYQRLVGGNIEIVNLERPSATLYFSEEGKLLELPTNRRATALLWLHNRAFYLRDVIAGDAFILGPADVAGEDTSVPEDFLDLLFSSASNNYQTQVKIVGHYGWHASSETFDNWYDAYAEAIGQMQRWSAIKDARVVVRR